MTAHITDEQIKAAILRVSPCIPISETDMIVARAVLALAPQQPSQGAGEGGWGIDVSAGREILVYGRCSVIEEEQARYVLNLIAADTARPAPEASGAMPLSEDELQQGFDQCQCTTDQYGEWFDAGARFAEARHGISATSKEAGE